MGIAQLTGKFLSPSLGGGVLRDLSASFYAECADQKASFFLWFPVFVAFGIGAYFSLPFELPLTLGIFTFVLSVISLVFSWRYQRVPAILFLLVSVGFLAAQTRTHMVHTPILQKTLGAVSVIGTIESIEDLGEGAGARLVLSNLDIERLSPRDTPVKVRLKVWRDEGLVPGQRVKAFGKIRKPSAPIMPGAFDFQRHLYFKQIGGVGFTFTDAEILEGVSGRSFNQLIERARQKVSNSVEGHMAYPQAPVAMALMTGRKTAIGKGDSEAMRNAGLAHMLAISGLHVGLFSGVIFFFVRLFLALIPNFALRHPIKKYAAVVAIAAAFGYMCLAGATIPTQRALLMTSIVFLAIILDRSPLSLRLVAFAALSVLLLFPESLLSASFHMSFGAVTGLIMFYEWIRPLWASWHRQAGFMRRVALYVVGVCMTTVVATLATAPFALFHFQQIATYSLLGNVIAMPLLAFIVMPSVVAALFLMPFGLEILAFYPMDIGVRGVLEVAHFVSNLPQAVFKTPAWPLSALSCLVLSMLVFTLWKGRFRFVSLFGFVFFISLIFVYKQPDILISSSYKLVGFKSEEGDFQILNTRKEKFVSENWARAYGLGPEALKKWPKEGANRYVRCGEHGCHFTVNGVDVAYVAQPMSAREDCAKVDILLSREPFEGCKTDATRVIDFFDVYRGGAHAIWINDGKFLVKLSEELRGRRPWSALNTKF